MNFDVQQFERNHAYGSRLILLLVVVVGCYTLCVFHETVQVHYVTGSVMRSI